jgi:hypothetical protein
VKWLYGQNRQIVTRSTLVSGKKNINLNEQLLITIFRPRAAAAAEVLWSGRYDTNDKKRDIGDAMPRIFDWRYRLIKRGIQAEALQPLWWYA